MTVNKLATVYQKGVYQKGIYQENEWVKPVGELAGVLAQVELVSVGYFQAVVHMPKNKGEPKMSKTTKLCNNTITNAPLLEHNFYIEVIEWNLTYRW